jgi:hypothetical protein
MSPVPPEKLDDCWFWIHKGLLKVIERAKADWTPADVYLAVKSKQAFLYTLGQDDAFIVLKIMQDQRGPFLFIWVLYGAFAHIRHEVMRDLRRLAQSVGARSLRVESPRGWHKWDLGWRIKNVIYEADIWE